MGKSGKKKYWVGFDLGGTKMLAAVLDGGLSVVGRERRKTKAQEGTKAGVQRIVETIQAALDAAKIDVGEVAGIGVGCPGPLDLDQGVLSETPNLGWKDVPLRKAVGSAFGCPVVVVNDVDAGVYGEYALGAARGARCVVGVFPGTGIGAGCVYEGRILRGTKNSCMELGHCQVLPDGPLCGCGQKGCLEAVASRLVISSASAAAAYRGEAPYLLEQVGTDLSNIRSKALATAIEAGDKAIENIVKAAAEWLGVGIANVVNLLAPDVVVLGGGLVEAMPDLILKTAEKTARERVLPSFRKAFRMAVAELGDDASVSGAAAWAKQTVESDV